MIFEKAYKELMAGKKIRRKEWEPLMHMRLIEGRIITYKGEHSHLYVDPNQLFFHMWNIVDDGSCENIPFITAIEALKAKKCIKRVDWIEDKLEQFIFIDNGQYTLCKQIEFDFMPTWSCLNSSDWEIMK